MCLISRKYNFICFQIPKTGSTTVYNLLEPFVDDKLDNIHSTYLEAKKIIDPGFFINSQKFAIVRNPYRWIHSLYSYISQNPAHHLHGKYSSFEDFVINNKELNQSHYIKDDNGNIAVETIQLEEIDFVLPVYLNTFGIKITSVPVMNKSKNLLDIINDKLQEDFIKYGYNRI